MSVGDIVNDKGGIANEFTRFNSVGLEITFQQLGTERGSRPVYIDYLDVSARFTMHGFPQAAQADWLLVVIDAIVVAAIVVVVVVVVVVAAVVVGLQLKPPFSIVIQVFYSGQIDLVFSILQSFQAGDIV
jgi:hypothetical protein